MGESIGGLLRLQSWFSPVFPIGGFSYSHGLEMAVELGWVRVQADLVDWLDAEIAHGTLRQDAILFAQAHGKATDPAALVDIAALAQAHRGTAELALEAEQQGRAFLDTVIAAWPDAGLGGLRDRLAEAGFAPTLAVVAGVAAARAGLAWEPGAREPGAAELGAREAALALFLQATVANLVQAAVRLVPLGQTDGQRAMAALETPVADAARRLATASLDDLGSAAVTVDVASLRHETQYTRLFRS